jgi:exosortase
LTPGYLLLSSPALNAEPNRTPPQPPISAAEAFSRFSLWLRNHPLDAALGLLGLGGLIYFFGFFTVFTNGQLSAAQWAWAAWNPENNQEHSTLILPIALMLVWLHRDQIATVPKVPSAAGLWTVLGGILCFVLGAWTLQPRLAIVALPFLAFGSVQFLWGRQVARIVLFPCAFLLFMIPIGNIVQGTVSLQLLVSSACNFLANLIGVKIEVAGTTIKSLDGSFNFEIAEGCSGIRSLMAMITVTALYVHFTQKRFWKQCVIFAGSIVFSLIGNMARIFTVILVAKFINPDLASGLYHDYSGFVFFPFAVATMVAFSNLLNRDWAKWLSDPPPSDHDPKEKVPSPISYDY